VSSTRPTGTSRRSSCGCGDQGAADEIDWYTSTDVITAVNPGAHQFTIGNPDGSGCKYFPFFTPGGIGRYYVEGDVSMVSDPGEFAVSGPYVHYIARGGGVPTAVVMPTTMDVVSFVGTNQTTRTSRIVLDGFSIQDSDANTWYRFAQHLNFTVVTPGTATATYINFAQQIPEAQHGGVLVTNADNLLITRTRVANTGLAGIFLEGYAQQVAVTYCLLEHCGIAGIFGEGLPPGQGDIQHHNTYSDLIIRYVGELNNGYGIELQQTGNNIIGPGECYYTPSTCIELMGWQQSQDVGMYTASNQVAGWRLHDCVHDSGDRGALSFEFTSNIGSNVFRDSIIDGVYPTSSMGDLGPGGANGILSDNETQGQILTNIAAGYTQGALLRNNTNGTGPIVTNCSFKADGTTNASFDESQMTYGSIGATAANPWYSSLAFTSFDDFEAGFGNFTVLRGSPVISTDQAHTGTHSVKQTSAGDLFYFQPGRRVYQHFEIWLYDSGANVDAMCSADQLTYNTTTHDYQLPSDGTNSNYAALGIAPDFSTTFYSFWPNRTGAATTVARSVGWHLLSWDASTGASIKVYIDGTQVGTVPGMFSISQVRVGDIQNRAHTGNAYWDGARFF
jgi:hypothetical protein